MSTGNPPRLASVDVFRVFAIVAVIVIHTTPFHAGVDPLGDQLDTAMILNQIARFAVPFFFVVSGYFWGRKVEQSGDCSATSVAMAKRIALLFVAWSMIYLIQWNLVDAFSYGPWGPIKQIYWAASAAIQYPVVTLFQGTKGHLWFLSSLLTCLGISGVLVRSGNDGLLLPLAIALYGVGLAGKAYGATPIGFDSGFEFRNGPFMALLFFVTGYRMRHLRKQSRWLGVGLGLALFGTALHFAEIALLHRYWNVSLDQDYVVGTYPMGVGVAIMALSGVRQLGFPLVARIGPFVLGVYAAHFMFVDLLQPLDHLLTGNVAWELVYVALVFLLSLGFAVTLSRVARLRWLVA